MELKFKNQTVSVTGLHQWYTYAGLLEGIPNDEMNHHILKNLPQNAIKHTYVKNFYLIEPEQTPINLGDRKYPFGKPMKLPGVICALALKYNKTSKPEVGGISELTLLFFQNSFCPPFESHILEEIEKIDWFAHARDTRWEDF